MSDELVFPLVTRRLVSGPPFGSLRARRRGSGFDVVGSRPYRPGDDVRRIDWHGSARLSARHGRDEFVVLEQLDDEAAEIVVTVDRRASMRAGSPDLPWLSKPDAVVRSVRMIADSARASGCALVPGQDDDAGPGHEVGALLARVPPVRAGAIVFVLSDFLEPPWELFQEGVGRGWELVPVVLQDPVWERSFPAVSGALLPIADPGTGRLRPTRLSGGEVRRRRVENEARFAELLARFRALGVDPVVPSSAGEADLLEAFLDWARARHRGARVVL